MKMKSLGALPLPSWRWLIGAVAVGVAVAITATTAAQISGDRWSISGSTIDEISFDSSGNMWAKPSQPRIISLDPATSALTTWTHANTTIFGSSKHGMTAVEQVAGLDRYVWQTAENMDHVNQLDIATGEVVSWPMPSSSTCARHNLALDASGNAWFGKGDEKVARLDPNTNTITEWPMPTAGNYCPRVFAVDGSDVWFCEAEIDKIGKLNSDTNTVTEWTIPGNNFNDCHGRDASGPNGDHPIWFSRTTTEILRLDPSSNELTIYTCPQGCGNVQGVSQESGDLVWFAEGSQINSFEPATGVFVDYTNTSCSPTTPFVDPLGNIWTARGGVTVCRFPPPGP